MNNKQPPLPINQPTPNTHHAPIFTGLENEDMTPTLKQIWVAVRQLQQDMNQIKIQVNEERALRSYLQQLLMGHLEGLSSTKNC